MLCKLLGKTRQAYYQRSRESEKAALEEELVLSEVMSIRARQKGVGGRKLYHMLSGFLSEHRMRMGRDAFFELLREHSLLVRRRRTRKPRTTFSQWGGRRYENLAKDLVPYRANQLWVSDITYIRMEDGFCYLSLITDAYSRKIVGYHLREDLTAKGCVAALKMALADNPDRAGLIHHSDRGVQYYSSEYMKALGSKIRISMSGKSDPLENAIAERVNGILKQEFLNRRYKDLAEARKEVAIAVSIYNNERPHLSVEMLTPSEAHQRSGPLKRYWKNYFQTGTRAALQASA